MTAFSATSFAEEPVKMDTPQLGASIYETSAASNSFTKPRYRSNYRSGGENTLSVVAGVDFGCYKSFPYNGVYVGALYNIMLSDAFGIEPGLELRWLMDKSFGTYHEVGWFVPVMANYSFEVGDEFYLSFFAGPTLDLTMVSVIQGWGSSWFGDGCCDLLLGALERSTATSACVWHTTTEWSHTQRHCRVISTSDLPIVSKTQEL